MVNLLHLNFPLIPVSHRERIQARSALDPHYLFDIYILFYSCAIKRSLTDAIFIFGYCYYRIILLKVNKQKRYGSIIL